MQNKANLRRTAVQNKPNFSSPACRVTVMAWRETPYGVTTSRASCAKQTQFPGVSQWRGGDPSCKTKPICRVGQAEALDLIMQNKPNSPAACRTNKANCQEPVGWEQRAYHAKQSQFAGGPSEANCCAEKGLREQHTDCASAKTKPICGGQIASPVFARAGLLRSS